MVLGLPRAPEGDLGTLGLRGLGGRESPPPPPPPPEPVLHEEDARRGLPCVVGRRPEAGKQSAGGIP